MEGPVAFHSTERCSKLGREEALPRARTMNPPPRAVTAFKALACVLFAGHMAATCAQQIPPQSALYAVVPPLAHYLELTGTWQSWNMFTTAPYFHSYNVDLEVTEADGAKMKRGVMLPGLERFDQTLRAESFFSEVLEDRAFVLYFDPYMETACSNLRAEEGHGGQTLVLVESLERLRRIGDIRANGVIATPEQRPSKSFTCGD